MEYLVLDFGNTNKKLAVFRNHRMVKLQQFPEISLPVVRNFIEKFPSTNHCILSSVINHPTSIPRFLASRFQFTELGETTPVPLKNRYRSKNTLGKDRLAAAVAGSRLFPDQNVLVVNAGSCITYDFVNAQNEYLGGVISPGIRMRLTAMHTFTGKLPLLSFRNKEIVIGRNTEGSMLSGAFVGATAEIEGIVGRYRNQYPDLNVVLSGGDQKYFVKRLKISIFAQPNIVLYGLQQILEFNVGKTT